MCGPKHEAGPWEDESRRRQTWSSPSWGSWYKIGAGRSSPQSGFVKKALLEQSYAHALKHGHGCFHATTAELRSCHTRPTKSKIFTIWPFTETVCLPWSRRAVCTKQRTPQMLVTGEPCGYGERGQKGPFDGRGSSLASAPETPQQLGVGPAGESPPTALATPAHRPGLLWSPRIAGKFKSFSLATQEGKTLAQT